MPEFSTPYTGMKSDRKLTTQELIRAIRYSIAAEYEATQLYMQLAESTDDKISKEILCDVADEERVHAGEFLRLLNYLAPDEMELYAKGAAEVDEIIENIRREGDSESSNSKDSKKDLPYCRTAPSAEHARWSNGDEPCDDGRSG
jgi:rubrerythrin